MLYIYFNTVCVSVCYIYSLIQYDHVYELDLTDNNSLFTTAFAYLSQSEICYSVLIQVFCRSAVPSTTQSGKWMPKC